MTQPAQPSPLLHYMDDLVESLRHLAPAALSRSDKQSVHHGRVGTRRMRAVIDLVSPVLRPKRAKSLSRTLRRLRRRLGPLRDTDVMLTHLKELRAQPIADAAAWLERLLRKQRRKLRAKVSKKQSPTSVLRDLATWRSLEHDILSAQDDLPDLLRHSAAEQLAAFTRQTRSVLGDRKAIGHAAPPDWHALRVAGKRLRYTLEMSAAAGHDLPPQTAKVFKNMQDALGLWHDYVVLGEQAMRSAAEENLAMTDPQLLASVLSLVRETQQRASKQLDAFAVIWRAQGDALTAQIALLYSTTSRARP